MRRIATAVWLFLLFLSPSARAERELIVAFGDAGHIVLGDLLAARLASAGAASYRAPIGLMTQSVRGPVGTLETTSIWLAPQADVFVASKFSLGGSVEVAHAWGSETIGDAKVDVPGTTSLQGTVRAGFYAELTDRLGVWPRLAIGYGTWESMQVARNSRWKGSRSEAHGKGRACGQ